MPNLSIAPQRVVHLLEGVPMKKLFLLVVATGFIAASCTSDVDSSADPLQQTTLILQPVTTAVSSTEAPDGDLSTTATSQVIASQQYGTDEWTAKRFELLEIATLSNPIAIASLPTSSDLWVAERGGRMQRLTKTGDEFDVAGPSLDITDKITTDGEGGLLSIDFSLDGKKLYTHYTNKDGGSVIAEFAFDASTGTADASSERILLEVDQPFSNHNGGQLVAHSDGFLYIGLGDGGSQADPQGNGQNKETLLGSILRINPDVQSDGKQYSVPADNPFVSSEGAGEVWSYGLRNPWRFSFDSQTGDLWIGDVGQNKLEEIDFLPNIDGAAGKGSNLGWNRREGNEPFEGGQGNVADLVDPLHVYGRDAGCSVTGGYVYRGETIQSLQGTYVYSDFCTGDLIGLTRQASGETIVGRLATDRKGSQVVSFGEGADGELYIVELSGKVSVLATSR